MGKYQKKMQNLVVSKPENHNYGVKRLKNEFKFSIKKAFFHCWG